MDGVLICSVAFSQEQFWRDYFEIRSSPRLKFEIQRSQLENLEFDSKRNGVDQFDY